eukprot:4783749-Pyramimonas_sp.AAC.1
MQAPWPEVLDGPRKSGSGSPRENGDMWGTVTTQCCSLWRTLRSRCLNGDVPKVGFSAVWTPQM